MADVLKKVPVREQAPKVRATNFEEVCLVTIKKRQWKKQTDALAVRKQNVWKDARYLSISQASFMK